MKPWSHLSNAHYIDWVLESVRTDPEKWRQAENAALNASRSAAWSATRDATRDAAWYAAWSATRDATRDAAWYAAWNAAWNADWNVAHIAALNATRYPILALIAYDDCDEYLNMSHEQLLAWAHLSERPQAVLLLPLKWVQEHEALVTSI